MTTSPSPETKPLDGESTTPPSATTVAPVTASGTRATHNLISISAAVLITSFFLPWISFLGAKPSGLDIQRTFSSYQYVFVMPTLALVVLVLNLIDCRTGFVRRVAGLCPFAILTYALSRLGGDLLQGIEAGGWLALAAGAALVVLPSGNKIETSKSPVSSS